jgi:hypothetical protein
MELRFQPGKLLEVGRGERLQALVTRLGQPKADGSGVVRVDQPLDQSKSLGRSITSTAL